MHKKSKICSELSSPPHFRSQGYREREGKSKGQTEILVSNIGYPDRDNTSPLYHRIIPKYREIAKDCPKYISSVVEVSTCPNQKTFCQKFSFSGL